MATIGSIQGAGHRSAFVGQTVSTSGVVTARESNGYYIQDAGDGDAATSDGLFVFTGARPTVAVGDAVELTGVVGEFTPGGAATGNLSTTQLGSLTSAVVTSSGNALPAATVIGAEGRTPPTSVIEDDNFASFDPTTDGIDFYESLEGMRVTVADAQAVSPTNNFGELWTVADQGAGVTGLTPRGGIVISATDLNPERVQIQFDNDVLPGGRIEANVGDTLGDVTGVVDYAFGNFEVKLTQAVTGYVAGSAPAEITELVGSSTSLTIASFNVFNLSPSDGEQIAQLAQQFVTNLKSPDIVALQEVQDASGETNDGVTSGAVTLQALVDAIAAAGGPTYSFAEIAPVDGSQGGVPGGNIRPAYLYNAARVDLDEASLTTLENSAFDDSRDPLVAEFTFGDDSVTLVNNHLTSKSGSTPTFGTTQPLVDVGLEQRLAQAQFLNDYVTDLQTAEPTSNIVVLGDMNEFSFNPPLEALTGSGDSQILFERLDTLETGDDYSYNFEGNSQTLDHIFVNQNLRDQTTLDYVHVNSDFVDQTSDHEPVVASIDFTEEPPVADNFRLQILHASDFEGGVDAVDRAGNFAAIVDKLEDAEANSITLSSGDGWIPSPFYIAGADSALGATYTSVYNQLLGLTGADAYTNLGVAAGRADITIQNIIGIDAANFGNHEFDSGTAAIASIIAAGAGADSVVGTADDAWVGAQFPYLSTNLDFSGDSALSGLFTDAIREAASYDTLANGAADTSGDKIAKSAIITENGEKIAVIGATTQLLASISSPGATEVIGADGNDIALLAEQINAEVARVKAANPDLDKIIVQSHLQQISLEQSLAPLLDDVDVIIAGGSNTRLTDGDDDLRPGDASEGSYPIVTADKNGNTLLIVNTDGEYSYVGRLVLEFDADGHIVTDSLDPAVNGAYATTDEKVAEVWGGEDAFATGTKGNLVEQVLEGADTDGDGDADTLGVGDIIRTQDGNLFGSTSVYLDGRRGEVRSEETNLGNLTADANLAAAKSVDSQVVVSLKNGGGIRDSIGAFAAEDGSEIPPAANPDAGKEAGDISQLDIVNSLRFNNALSIVTVTATGLLAIVEHGFAAVAPGATPGAFPQIGGMEVSFDPDAASGERVRSLAILDASGGIAQVVVRDGEIVGDAERLIKMVTLSFLADGGDGYPFEEFVVDREDLTADNVDAGDATFAAPGTEQDALAEYLLEEFSETPYGDADTTAQNDERIQRLDVRDDAVLDGIRVVGTNFADTLEGTSSADPIFGGRGDDTANGGLGDDSLYGSLGDDNLIGDEGDDLVAGGDGNDLLEGRAGADTLGGNAGDDELRGGGDDDRLNGGLGNDTLYGGSGNDTLAGGPGDDKFYGGSGADAFLFPAVFGNDAIVDFQAGEDILVFTNAFETFDAFTAATSQSGANLLVTVDPENVLTLVGVTLADLSDADVRIA